MANYQNNMRCMRCPSSASPSPVSGMRRMDGCPDTSDFFPADIPLAMAYVKWQEWQNMYEPCEALERGTLFQELDKPFLGKGGRQR